MKILISLMGVIMSQVISANLLEQPLRLLNATQEVQLASDFPAKAYLVVNTASRCGYTSQYQGLQNLHQRFAEQGLQVIGFPSMDFAGQEFEDEAQTANFCAVNFAVSFPLMATASVKGPQAQPFWQQLTQASESPAWNFHKYLLDAQGQVVAVFPSSVAPEDARLLQAIEPLLAK